MTDLPHVLESDYCEGRASGTRPGACPRPGGSGLWLQSRRQLVDWDDYDDDRQEPAQPSAEQRELEVLRTRNRYLEGRVSQLESERPPKAEELSLPEQIALAEREGRWSDSMGLKNQLATQQNVDYHRSITHAAPAGEPASLED